MNLTLRSLRAMKQSELTAMLTAAMNCRMMLLDEKSDPKGFQDFMNAITMKVFRGKVIAFNLDERLGRLRFTLQDEVGNFKAYEMHHIDSETRMYGSSASFAGERFRVMYGTMRNDWYCVRMSEDQTDLVSLTKAMA